MRKKTAELRFSSLAAMPWQNLEARHSETFRGIYSVLFYSIACRFDGNVACRTARRIVRKKHRKGRPPGAMVSKYPLGAHVVHHPA